MGGVDLHDRHCNNVLSNIRSKKLTWIVFIRLVQASIVNALVIFNAAGDEENRVGAKDFVISIAKSYMRRGQVKREIHKMTDQKQLKVCSNCFVRTKIFCEKCAFVTSRQPWINETQNLSSIFLTCYSSIKLRL